MNEEEDDGVEYTREGYTKDGFIADDDEIEEEEDEEINEEEDSRDDEERRRQKEERRKRKEEKKILREVLMTSEEPLCRIFVLRYFYFFRVKEIAALLKLSNKQVENHLYRGKDILKRELLKRGWK